MGTAAMEPATAVRVGVELLAKLPHAPITATITENALMESVIAELDLLARIAPSVPALLIAMEMDSASTTPALASKVGLDLTAHCKPAQPSAPETDIATMEHAFANPDSPVFSAPCPHAPRLAPATDNVSLLALA